MSAIYHKMKFFSYFFKNILFFPLNFIPADLFCKTRTEMTAL
ncbi:hypothetical protein HMPREF9953_0442 [Haemophilus parainfluenzae ATCC 33392]|uniref:Uncharacterized protein n=1 Tax=Haemophilus parainfluenzae HK2019 TaxID=1095746 RepID=A0ABP2NZC8_HAEPA|nr:hypothetical protein HMPREF1118_1526 [Haemophilus parainfluenzae HK262]EIJ31533.1 hypothetical protein HMPREF1119_0448 [Haemophilus parainfluenzae HK2019]KFL98558.1 hypothetical protein HMPREF9953_0442 [Haemophilus parainfluenzae ATCC 33392]